MSTGRWMLIAEFARRCRLPVSTLRYYDRVGLLRPAAVDPATGYRRYTAEQLPDALTVACLRELGVAPDAIAAVLAGGGRRASALAAERARIESEIADRSRALQRLDLLAAPRPGPLPCEVDLVAVTVPAVAFATPFADLAAAVTRAGATLRARLRRGGPPPERFGALLPLDLDDRVRGHVFARIDPGEPAPPGTGTVALPGGRAVRMLHHGPADGLGASYRALFAEIDRRGACPVGPVVEDYPSGGPTVDIRVPITAPAPGPGVGRCSS